MNGLIPSVIAALLPSEDRECILGDLLEDGERPGSVRHLIAVSGVALHVHAESYRDETSRRGILASMVLGLGLIWAVHTADWQQGPALDLYSDPFSRIAIRLWGASHLTSALAAGLLVGHAPWIQRPADPSRWHVGLLLAGAACWAAPATGLPVLPGVLLLGAIWVGDRARDQGPASRPEPCTSGHSGQR